MKKIKVRMKKKFKIPLVILVVGIVLVLILMLVNTLFSESSTNTYEIEDTIAEYGYTLDTRDTTLMKSVYSDLKECLSSEKIDYEEYATLIAKLFVIDLFTMDNKINKYDVGSTEYILESSIDNFKANVEDTIYKSMEDNSDNKRNQDLPEVEEITSVEIEDTTYTVGEEEYDGYIVYITWEYKRDYGYDSKATIILIKKDEKIYVVQYSEGIDE